KRIHVGFGTSSRYTISSIAERVKTSTAIMGMKTFHCHRIPVAHRTMGGRVMRLSHQRRGSGASQCLSEWPERVASNIRHRPPGNPETGGILPLQWKKIDPCWRRSEFRFIGGFVSAPDTFDLVVIGCGPAGEKAGAQAAYFGKRVAILERAGVPGGSCINTGTVPSKTLRESALYFSGLAQRGLYGIDYSLKENLTVHDFLHHQREVVEMERRRILKNLELHKIAYLEGQASFEDAHTIAARVAGGTRKLRGEVILIATGSKPHRPAEIAFDDVHTFDSDTFLQMNRIPKSLAVIGGGVIGCEYASIFMALDVDVTLVDGRDRLLPFLDREISDPLP